MHMNIYESRLHLPGTQNQGESFSACGFRLFIILFCFTDSLSIARLDVARPSLLQPRLLLQLPQLQLLLQPEVGLNDERNPVHHIFRILWGREQSIATQTSQTVSGCRLSSCNLLSGAAAPGVDTGAVGKPKDCSTCLLEVLFHSK